MVSCEPDPGEADDARSRRVCRRIGAAATEPGQVLAGFIDRIRRSRKAHVLAEKPVEVFSGPMRSKDGATPLRTSVTDQTRCDADEISRRMLTV